MTNCGMVGSDFLSALSLSDTLEVNPINAFNELRPTAELSSFDQIPSLNWGRSTFAVCEPTSCR